MRQKIVGTAGIALLLGAAVLVTGRDAWLAAGYRDEIRTQDERREILTAGVWDAADRIAYNHRLAHEVAVGHRSLQDAAAALWAKNRETPGFAAGLSRFNGSTPTARAAQLILHLVEEEPARSAGERAAVMERLCAEYVAAFGPLAPADGTHRSRA